MQIVLLDLHTKNIFGLTDANCKAEPIEQGTTDGFCAFYCYYKPLQQSI